MNTHTISTLVSCIPGYESTHSLRTIYVYIYFDAYRSISSRLKLSLPRAAPALIKCRKAHRTSSDDGPAAQPSYN